MGITTTARPATSTSTRSGQTGLLGSSPATPYRNKNSRVNGLLKQGKTRIAEITDGTSNTIAIGEDAGRDPRYLSPYVQDVFAGIAPNGVYYATTTAYLAAVNPNDPGPAGGEALYRRYWRWAEPDENYGVSGAPNNKFRPDHETHVLADRRVPSSPRATTPATTTSSHRSIRAASTCLMGDGSVRFLKDSVNVVTLRGLVTLQGGEVISADQY